MPIHDQSYRRYGGGRGGAGPRVDGHRLGRDRIDASRSGSFLGLLLVRLDPVHRPRRPDLHQHQLSPGGDASRRRRETFRQFLEQQDFFVFLITVYVGAGLIANDRRANALQIYLSKPLLRARIHRRQARRCCSCFLLLVTWVPAILLLFLQVLFAGNFDVPEERTCSCSRRSPSPACCRSCSATFTMLALSSLSKSSRYVGILYAGIMFFTDAIFGVLCAHHRQSSRCPGSRSTANVAQVVDVIFRPAATTRRRGRSRSSSSSGLIVVSISVLERRVRGVEVVT